MATFQTAGYPVPPANFAAYDYRTPPMTPPHSGGHTYYSPRQHNHSSNTTPSSKGHFRRATNGGGDATYTATYTTTTYSTPRKPAHYSTTDFGYFTSAQSTPQRKNDYVSGSERRRERARTYHPEEAPGKPYPFPVGGQSYSSRSPRYVVVEGDIDDGGPRDRSDEYLPRYEPYEPRPPPYHSSRQESQADHIRFRDQVPIYTPADPTPTPHGGAHASHHRRRASYAAKPTPPPSRPRPSTAGKAPLKATDEDARKAGIPAGYSFKNWDPTEEPILLLGSVFDANSLGKWIYDWTVFYFGPATPISEVAGDFWLLLIQLAHKVKRAEDMLPYVRSAGNRDLIDDFLESGERLWQRFNKLLKICENYMWKVAKREHGSANPKNITMGKNSGCEFVDAIFGRDRELERTEKLMTGMRLWSLRFDANCEEILRNPSA